jgi:hypothetical protein
MRSGADDRVQFRRVRSTAEEVISQAWRPRHFLKTQTIRKTERAGGSSEAAARAILVMP